VAAIAVALKHLQNLSGLHLHVQQAAMAVDLFFVLSGYVISRSYEARLADGLSVGSYMGLRILRLYPAIFGALVIALALRLAFHGLVVPQMAMQFVLLPVIFGPAMFGGELFPLDGPQWSLFWELTINGVHAAIFRWLTIPRIIAILAVSAAGLAIAVAQWGWLDVGWTRRTAWCAAPRATYGFFMGVLIFRLQQRGVTAPKLPYLLIVGALCVAMIRWTDVIDDFWISDMLLAMVVLPAIVAFGVVAEVPRVLAKPAIWLGAISYPLYAVHVPLLRGVRWWLLDHPVAVGPERTVIWIVALAAVIGAAAAYEKYYDAPIRGFLAQRRARRAKLQLAPAG
jgi:peptidoglycan/LPS O-acetylase OafA/YrhL